MLVLIGCVCASLKYMHCGMMKARICSNMIISFLGRYYIVMIGCLARIHVGGTVLNNLTWCAKIPLDGLVPYCILVGLIWWL